MNIQDMLLQSQSVDIIEKTIIENPDDVELFNRPYDTWEDELWATINSPYL